jgi:hypothetical protein
MNVTQLSGRGIDARAIRYVLDHGVVTGVDKDTSSRGAPRVFDAAEAEKVAVAALLIRGGLKRGFVQGFVRGFYSHGSGQWFREMRSSNEDAEDVLEIGDRTNVRLIRARDSEVAGRWLDVGTRKAVSANYVPLVVLRIDLSELRRRLAVAE